MMTKKLIPGDVVEIQGRRTVFRVEIIDLHDGLIYGVHISNKTGRPQVYPYHPAEVLRWVA
jgi:hypothetical protein